MFPYDSLADVVRIPYARLQASIEGVDVLHPAAERKVDFRGAMSIPPAVCVLVQVPKVQRPDRRRWCFLVAFNRRDNDPLIDHHHPRYTPLADAADDAILTAPLVDSAGKDFMDPKDDASVRQYQKQGFH